MVLIFRICDQNSAGNTPMSQLLLSSAHIASKPFLTLPTSEQAGGAQAAGRGCRRDSRPTPADQRDIPHQLVCAQQYKLGEEGRKEGISNNGVRLPM